ncbi:MAG: SUMF1/EgtB/PvdO family nonheme iron enzyme [Caldimonas sp.]
MLDLQSTSIDFARLRSAGKDLLSLALIDARNRSLLWASLFETVQGGRLFGLEGEPAPGPAAGLDPPLWTLGHLGWFQERWIARNVQRGRGDRADPDGPRLASVLPGADRWYDPAAVAPAARRALAAGELPDLQATRTYLVETLETTLDLLDAAREEDDGTLYFFRLALFHEEQQLEAFAVLAQTLGVEATGALVPRLVTQAARAPLFFPASRWLHGAGPPGFVFDNERAPHPVALPEFEIDAQAVTWAQYGEFVEDGGYDEPAHWSEAGWAWAQREARRTPRHVDQMRHGVLRRRFGQLSRVANAEPAVHVSAWEAEAWCRWAARRLPGEVEWEAAAHLGATRGFRFGDVWEWTATTFRPYPGFVPGPWRDYSLPSFGSTRVLRGASLATPSSLRSARFRRFAEADRDDGFFGFRSCAA